MKAKTELLLYRILWLAEMPMRPTFRNLDQGFECWAYRGGILRQIRRLEAQGYLETLIDPATGDRLHRLTESGRLAAIGGRDPEAAWASQWDRKWRIFLFDIPETERSKRRKLTRALAADPLLPAELLPKAYLGRKVWQVRKTLLSRAAQALGGKS